MIYVIAVLLLILVLSNETARSLLFLLLAGAVSLAIVAAVLFVIFMVGVWIFSSGSAKVQTPVAAPATPTPLSTGDNIFVILIVVGIAAAIIYDQYKLRKK